MRGKNKKTKILIFLIASLFFTTIIFPAGDANQQKDEAILQQIKQSPNKILLEDKTIMDIHVKYWTHKIGDIEIKNDYVLLQTDINNGEIIKYEKQWRDIQKISEDIPLIKFDNADIAWKKLVIFLEENDLSYFYYTDKNQEFPLLCWEVRYNDGRTSLIDINGQKIGAGVPAPSEEYRGFSLSGYCQTTSPDCWISWRLSADNWFQKWCVSSTSLSLPTPAIISAYVSNPDYHLFYELAHGASTYFQADSPGIYYYSSDVEQAMQQREKMKFAFIGSCEGMTDIGDGTFSYEFRKGSLEDTVTVGYSGMGTCPGWSVSLQWQNFMFYAMDSDFTIQDAFNLACAEYPTIADCVVFVGDPDLKIIEGGGGDDDDDDDETIPSVLITYPKESSIVDGTVKITGTADDLDGDITKIYIKIDNGKWQEASGTYSWEYTWDTTIVSDGLHKITAVSIDNNGYQSGCYYLNLYVINNLLETNIIALDQASTTQKISFNSSTTGGLAPYNHTWDFDDGTISYDPNPSHTYISPGEYSVTLTTRDRINNTDIDTKNILIIGENDDVSPVIELVEPENGLYISNNKILSLESIIVIGKITIKAQVSDSGGSGLERVEFYLDDDLEETFDGSSFVYQWTWGTTAFFKHKITIKAYDYADNSYSKDIDIFKFG